MATLLNLNPTNTSDKANNKQFNVSMFTQENVKSVLLKKSKNGGAPMRVRILPSFDFSLYGSEVFNTSVAPFKTPDMKGLTDWCIAVKGYTYFGNLWTHFLSPATLQPNFAFPRKGTDPIVDLRSFIFKSNRDRITLSDGFTPLIDSDALNLITPDPITRFVKLPAKPRDFILVNALVENNETKVWEQQILIMTKQAFGLLCDILEVRPKRSDPNVTPSFPDYLFGDITDPSTGCILEAREVKTDSNLQALTLCPSSDNKTLTGHIIKPIDDSVLKNRYVLSDPETTIKIWTYQEILDQMCKDPMIPVDLLKLAQDFNVFAYDSVLNLDLREEGEAELAKIKEAIAKKSNGSSTITNTTFTQGPTESAVQIANKLQQANTNALMGALQNKNDTIQQVSTPSLNIPIQQLISPEQPVETTTTTTVINNSNLTEAEEKEYQDLLSISMNCGSMNTDQIQRYIQLMQKRG